MNIFCYQNVFLVTSPAKTIEFERNISEKSSERIYNFLCPNIKGLISSVVILLNFHNENFGDRTNKGANCVLVSWKATYLKVEKSLHIWSELKQNDIEPNCYIFTIKMKHFQYTAHYSIYKTAAGTTLNIFSCWHIEKNFYFVCWSSMPLL